MIRSAVLILAVLIQTPQTGKPVPDELVRLMVKAGIDSPVASWCRGSFRGPRGYAVALTSEAAARYVVIESDASVVELARFSAAAEITCRTPDVARELDRTIRSSETISGGISPRWAGSVVCGFLSETRAACWQYSPRQRKFLPVGGWET